MLESDLATQEFEGSSSAAATPLVSVLVPVYNEERYLEECLDSVLAQTYRHLEVIVVDDASTDRTAEIAEKSAGSDGRVRVFRNERNQGLFGTLNVGLGEARGELVAIQNADDVYLTTIIQREVEFLAVHPEVGAVYALDLFIDEAGREFGRVEPPSELRGILDYRTVLDGILRRGNTFIRGGTSLVRREVYADVGPFDSSYDLRGDLDMWLRIASRRPIGIIGEYLACYRWGHGNMSGRYGHLREAPEHFFSLMDHRLAAGDAALAERGALTAYEARRSEDLLMVAVNLYILDRRAESRAILSRVRPVTIAATRSVQRWRLLLLWTLLQTLVRLPRIVLIADRFYRRWHAKPLPAGAAE